MLALLSINLELIYLILASGVILIIIYFLRKFVTKNEEEEKLDEHEIAKQEVESMILHEDIILDEEDIEKEVARGNYNLEDEVDKEKQKEENKD